MVCSCFYKKRDLDFQTSSRTILSLILTALMQHESLCCDSNVNQEASLCLQTVILKPNGCLKESVLPGRKGTRKWDSSQSKSVILQPRFQMIVIKSKLWHEVTWRPHGWSFWYDISYENEAHPWKSASQWIWPQWGVLIFKCLIYLFCYVFLNTNFINM